MTTRPECADGCPLTDTSGCTVTCVRAPTVPAGTCECGTGPATVEVVPDYFTCTECAVAWRARIGPLESLTPGHVGEEVTAPKDPPTRTRLPAEAEGTSIVVTPDVPFQWAPYVALLTVIVIAALCAMAGLLDGNPR